MKLKKINLKHYKLLKLYLLNLGISLTGDNNNYKNRKRGVSVFIDNKLDVIEWHLKVVSKIIQNYHFNKRKILFVSMHASTPPILEKILKKAKHHSIAATNWTPGIFKTCLTVLRQTPKKRTISHNHGLFVKRKQLAETLKNKRDLIVIMGSYIDPEILKEITQLNVPVIALNNDLKLDKTATYKLLNNFTSLNIKQKNSFYFHFLYAILKKQKPK